MSPSGKRLHVPIRTMFAAFLLLSVAVLLYVMHQLPSDLNQVASTLQSVSRGTGHRQSKGVTPMLQPAAVDAPDGSRMQLHLQLRGTVRVLYAVATCSAPGFPPIVDAIFETWGSDLPRKQLVLAGGLKDDFIEGLAEEETPCGDKGGDFWCKEAVTLWRGAQRAKELNAGWLCVSQEDKYIWTDAVDKEFSKFDPSVPGVYGAWGCAQQWKYNPMSKGDTVPRPAKGHSPPFYCDPVSRHGALCGGPTYFVSRGMLLALTKGIHSQKEFLKVFRNATAKKTSTGSSDILSTCFFYDRLPDGKWRMEKEWSNDGKQNRFIKAHFLTEPANEGANISAMRKRAVHYKKLPLTMHLNQKPKTSIPEYMHQVYQTVFSRSDIHFVEFPHNLLWQSTQPLKCKWQTHTLQRMQSIQAVHGRIQTRANSDGFCQSENLPEFNIFSVDEARECLTGRHIVMAGDAALEDTFAGLLDILLNNVYDNHIPPSAAKRQAAILRSMKKLEDCQNDKFGAESDICPRVRLVCYKAKECRSSLHDDAAAAKCRKCLEREASSSDAVIFSNSQGEVETIDKARQRQLNWMLHHVPKLIYHFGSDYTIEQSAASWFTMLYADILSHNGFVRSENKWATAGVPVLDMHGLIESCPKFAQNCSVKFKNDHLSARHVSRMKGQMVLNMLCETRTTKIEL